MAMERDDSPKPALATGNRYNWLAKEIKHNLRYVWGEDVQALLDTVLATNRDRDGGYRIAAKALDVCPDGHV